jgi:hypothetical protein
MLHVKLPEKAKLIPGRDDVGKRVIVNSPGLVNVKGTVLCGPYTYPYLHKYKVKPKNNAKDRYGRERLKNKEEIRDTSPLWLIALDGYNREFSFLGGEFTVCTDDGTEHH